MLERIFINGWPNIYNRTPIYFHEYLVKSMFNVLILGWNVPSAAPLHHPYFPESFPLKARGLQQMATTSSYWCFSRLSSSCSHLFVPSNSSHDTVSGLFDVRCAYLGFVLTSLKSQGCQIKYKAPSYIWISDKHLGHPSFKKWSVVYLKCKCNSMACIFIY